MDPSQYCSGRHVLKPFLDESVSTAQQILVRGPLKMVTKASFATQSTLIPNHILSIGLIPNSPIYVFFLEVGASGETTTSAGSQESQNSGVSGTQVILVGVSTEVTVGIALASFVIGVGLTAILWCIHMRTGIIEKVPRHIKLRFKEKKLAFIK